MAQTSPLTHLETHITQEANAPAFIHYKWFITHHLKIIEQLVNELCDLYPAANRTACLAMVWLHDFGKILTNKQVSPEKEQETTLTQSAVLLEKYGFSPDDTALILECLKQMDEVKTTAPTNLHLETKIISSADAAAHYIGPFFALYWYENPGKPVDALIADNQKKLLKDSHKVLLPEIETFLQPRRALLEEYLPTNRPTRFLT